MSSNKEIVARATTELFTDLDVTAIDRYFVPGYGQHSTIESEGGLRGFLTSPPAGFGYELVRVLGDGDLVATHGVYSGLGAKRMVAFDLFRIDDGRVVEHWDGLTPERPANSSGRTLVDGPAQITQPELTESTRTVVQGFFDTVVFGGKLDAVADFVADDYRQHNPEVGDGRDAFVQAMESFAASGVTVRYREVSELVADGEFAVALSDAVIGSDSAVWDMFRVHNGRIAEHWDLVLPIPSGIRYF